MWEGVWRGCIALVVVVYTKIVLLLALSGDARLVYLLTSHRFPRRKLNLQLRSLHYQGMGDGAKGFELFIYQSLFDTAAMNSPRSAASLEAKVLTT